MTNYDMDQLRSLRACARAAIQACLDRDPVLCEAGIGLILKERHLPEPAYSERLAELRQEMFTPDNIAGFVRARAWLAQFPKAKTFCRTSSSYGLKHTADIATGYVPNGVFIAAAMAEGFAVERCSNSSPNVHFNIGPQPRRRPSAAEAQP